MALFVREPPRLTRSKGGGAFDWRDTGRYLLTHRSSTLYVMFGFALLSALPAVAAWTPAFLSRTYGWTPAHIGPVFGLIQLVTNPAGIALGGVLADHLRRRGIEDGALRIIMASLAAALPFFLLFPLATTGDAAMLIFAPANFFMMLCFGASTPVIPLLVPAGMRAQAVAVMFLTANLIGSLGPMLIPLATQDLFHDPKALRFSLVLIPLAVCPTTLFWLLSRRRPFLDQVVRLRGDAE
jgi:MFS family permease